MTYTHDISNYYYRIFVRDEYASMTFEHDETPMYNILIYITLTYEYMHMFYVYRVFHGLNNAKI